MNGWTDRLSRVGKRPPRSGNPSAKASSSDLIGATPPAPYPRELEHVAILADGARLFIRPIRPDDEPRLVELYSRLSEQTAYQRFFTLMRRLPPTWFHFFANVDYRRRLALVAEHDTAVGPELIGVGRYESTGDEGTAEVALVVQDGWQGHGLGTVLLEDVLKAGAARGIRRFSAYVLADNHRMLHLLTNRVDVLARGMEDGVVALTFTPKGAEAA
jgi:RimJ/RimL family protein N-acetyltransferase